MSLVNKMLRDLDARRVGDGDRAALPAAVTPLAARQESSRTLPWLGAILTVAVLAAAWYGTHNAPSPPPSSPPIAVVAAAPPVPERTEPISAPTPEAAVNAAMPSLRMASELSAAPVLASEPSPKPVAATPKTSKMPERPTAGEVAPQPPMVALSNVQPIPAAARIEKQVRLPSATERAETEYRKGSLAQRQGNTEGAAVGYRAALDEHAEHAAARQALAALLIEAKRLDEAEELLLKGTELAPVRLASTLALARLKVERNQAAAALEVLQANAASGERSAEYQGFTGALLNRSGRAAEAVEHYQTAVRLAASEGRWWAGLGIALDAAGKGLEAREAYQKARSLPGLPADLAQHIEQRLR